MTSQRERDAYRAEMLERLDAIDERERESAAMSDRSTALFMDLVQRRQSALERYAFATRAFPGMTWDEFSAIDLRRSRSGKRGRRAMGLDARADTPIARAARDVDRLKAFWRERGTRSAPPVDPYEIAAQRHGVSEEEIGERARRGKSRNPHRLLADD